MRDTLVVRESLAGTVDRASEQLFFGRAIEWDEADRVVDAFLARRIVEGSRAGMFNPAARDVAGDVRLFTGERLHTKLAICSVLSLEAGRILHRLGMHRDDARKAVEGVLSTSRRTCFGKDHCVIGECAHSSVALLRFLVALRTPAIASWVEEQIELIRHHRDGTGRWDGFPLHYTALALVEADTPAAHVELDYAGQALHRAGRRGRGDHQSEGRRRLLLDAVRERAAAAMPVLL